MLLALAVLALFQCAAPELRSELRPDTSELGEFISRDDYLKLLEPRGDRILHGAGANPFDFADYWKEMARTPPVLYATHIDLATLRPDWVHSIRQVIDRHREAVIPQIAVSLTYEGRPYEVEVTMGELDRQLDILCHGLRSLDRPVFLRIAYGFGSPSTGYRPEPYRHAWARIVETIRLRYGLRHVAMVWCYAADSAIPHFMDYYPGERYVDWWALDVFDPRTFGRETTRSFLAAARQHGFPVMIGETAPRVAAIAPDSKVWEYWFVPFFRFVRRNPGIKAFSYINWEAGDTRIAADLDLLQRYRQTLKDATFQHAVPFNELRWQLEWPD